VCRGRTVVKTDNSYLTEIAPMAVSSPLVKHAILSLSITYVMDYKANPDFEHTARDHHMKAVQLLGQELRTMENYKPGKEEAVVAALCLLTHNEVLLSTFSHSYLNNKV
jgi:hypothetical protein